MNSEVLTERAGGQSLREEYKTRVPHPFESAQGRLFAVFAGGGRTNFYSLGIWNFATTAYKQKAKKQLVGERGFEPPTPWSRNRFEGILRRVEFCRS